MRLHRALGSGPCREHFPGAPQARFYWQVEGRARPGKKVWVEGKMLTEVILETSGACTTAGYRNRTSRCALVSEEVSRGSEYRLIILKSPELDN